jgi:hypothetical protein
MRYDLCQHCFFYGLSSRGHRLDHPMREYCFRSSKRDATKAWIRLIINNIMFVGRSGAAKRHAKKRFLPHDPRLEQQGPILQSSILAENFSDKFSSSNFRQIFILSCGTNSYPKTIYLNQFI